MRYANIAVHSAKTIKVSRLCTDRGVRITIDDADSGLVIEVYEEHGHTIQLETELDRDGDAEWIRENLCV